MSEISGILNADGLLKRLQPTVEALLSVMDSVNCRNEVRRKYFEGKSKPVDIGIGTVHENVNVSVTCDWPRLAVERLADRSRFDGFVFDGQYRDHALDSIMRDNGIISKYLRFTPSQLMHGCMAATVGMLDGRAIVRMHSAEHAPMLWDEAHERIGAGLVIADSARTRWSKTKPVPVQVNMHTPGEVTVFTRRSVTKWDAKTSRTPLDRPMMEPFVFKPDGDNPFGHSRISKAVIDMTDEVMRTLENMAVAGALYAAPQKFIMGLTQEQYEELQAKKWSTYIGSWVFGTMDEDGHRPDIGQLAPASPQPYIDTLRAYASMFSGVTGVPMSSLGIIQDNPSSAEAIAAGREDLCIAAETLNASNGDSLRNVALMAMAVAGNCSIDELSVEQKSVMAHFKPTLHPSLAETADAALKIVQAAPGFAETDVFWEMLGQDEATIRRINSDVSRGKARNVLDQLAGLEIGSHKDE